MIFQEYIVLYESLKYLIYLLIHVWFVICEKILNNKINLILVFIEYFLT